MIREAGYPCSLDTMAESSSVKDFVFSTSEDEKTLAETLQHLVCMVKTEWTPVNIKHKPLSGGFVNSMWVCSHGDDPVRVVVRVYPNIELNPFPDREREINLLAFLSQQGFFPPILARFKNGFLYTFVEGRALTEDDMHNDHIMGLVVRNVRRVHQLPWKSATSITECERYRCLLLLDELPQELNSGRYQDWCRKSMPSKDVLQQDVAKCLPLFDSIASKYPVVLCHRDLWHANIVYDQNKDEVVFLDWEMGGGSIVPMEFAVLLENWIGESSDAEYKRKWIRVYLELSGEVSDDMVETWYRDTLKACMIAQLGAVMFVLRLLETDPPSIQPNIPGLLEYGEHSYKKYQAYEQLLVGGEESG